MLNFSFIKLKNIIFMNNDIKTIRKNVGDTIEEIFDF